jgi:hypothetical protein
LRNKNLQLDLRNCNGSTKYIFSRTFILGATKKFSAKKRFLSANTGALLEAFCLQKPRRLRSFSILVLKTHSENEMLTICEMSR